MYIKENHENYHYDKYHAGKAQVVGGKNDKA